MNLVLAYPGCFGKKQNEFVVNFFYFLTAEMRLCCTGWLLGICSTVWWQGTCHWEWSGCILSARQRTLIDVVWEPVAAGRQLATDISLWSHRSQTSSCSI